ncbi:MAG: hypothetical protein PHE25_02430 [Candidatus Gracilibacteria bacterium]|nr:hypothetical protein [Candidatus Gracilibacteria bacterium]
MKLGLFKSTLLSTALAFGGYSQGICKTVESITIQAENAICKDKGKYCSVYYNKKGDQGVCNLSDDINGTRLVVCELLLAGDVDVNVVTNYQTTPNYTKLYSGNPGTYEIPSQTKIDNCYSNNVKILSSSADGEVRLGINKEGVLECLGLPKH